MLDRLGAKDARARSMLCVRPLAHLLYRMNIRSVKRSWFYLAYFRMSMVTTLWVLGYVAPTWASTMRIAILVV